MEYLDWLRWWRERGAAALSVRIGSRLRHGVSGEEIFQLLASANRELGVRANNRQPAAVAMEIRHWYREELDDPPRRFWFVTYTRHER